MSSFEGASDARDCVVVTLLFTENCTEETRKSNKGLFNAPLSARVARHFPRKRGKLRERDCRHLQPPLLAGEGDHAKRGGRGEIMSVGSGTVLTKRFSRGIADEMKSFSLAQILWSAAETNRTHSRAMWRICRQRQNGKDAQDGGLNESVLPNSKLG